jgi:hypothetical protein
MASVVLKRAALNDVKTIDITDNDGNVIETLEYSPTNYKSIRALAQFAQIEPMLKGRITPEKITSFISALVDSVDTIFGEGTFDFLVEDSNIESGMENVSAVMSAAMPFFRTESQKKDAKLEALVLDDEPVTE